MRHIMRHIMHTVEHAALVQAAAYGKHRVGALCGKTVDIDLSGYFITYDRPPPPAAHPCKIARRMRALPRLPNGA